MLNNNEISVDSDKEDIINKNGTLINSNIQNNNDNSLCNHNIKIKLY
jgi:hypothetical protein